MHRVVVLGLSGVLVLGSILSASPAPALSQVGTPVAADVDFDGVSDELDNCVDIGNVDQVDSDGDWAGDACASTPNGGRHDWMGARRLSDIGLTATNGG
jgi:hypothetical protein